MRKDCGGMHPIAGIERYSLKTISTTFVMILDTKSIHHCSMLQASNLNEQQILHSRYLTSSIFERMPNLSIYGFSVRLQ